MIAVISLVACSESNEKKAEKLIKKEMNKVLVNIDTYEPIETVMDSAFAPLMTAENLNILSKLPAQIELYTKLQDEVTDAEIKMNISKSINSSEYNRCKEQYERSYGQLKDLESKMTALKDKIEQQTQEERIFNGYLVRHSYRYITKEGDKTIGQHLFLMDKDFTKVEVAMDLEDEKIKSMFELFNLTNFPEN